MAKRRASSAPLPSCTLSPLDEQYFDVVSVVMLSQLIRSGSDARDLFSAARRLADPLVDKKGKAIVEEFASLLDSWEDYEHMDQADSNDFWKKVSEMPIKLYEEIAINHCCAFHLGNVAVLLRGIEMATAAFIQDVEGEEYENEYDGCEEGEENEDE